MDCCARTGKIIFLVVMLCLSSVQANADFWNPFGPKNYDECVLDKIKDVKSESAVQALKDSCEAKFPEKISAQERAAIEKDESLRKKCGIPKDAYTRKFVLRPFMSQEGIYLSSSARLKVLSHINNLTDRAFVSGSDAGGYFSFQNRNAYRVTAVQIGITQKGSNTCQYTLTDYAATTYCVNSNGDSVGAFSYGTLSCRVVPPTVRSNPQYCVIGISPEYNRFTNALAEWMDKNGLCD